MDKAGKKMFEIWANPEITLAYDSNVTKKCNGNDVIVNTTR